MKLQKSQIQDKFENPIGQEFYTYYLEESNRRTRFNVDTGIFKVKILSENPNSVFMEYKYEIVEVLGKPTEKVKNDLLYYINSFHARSANELFTTEEEANKDYDNTIKRMLRNPRCNANELKLLQNKLLNKMSEQDQAKIWYDSLEPVHKNFFKILKYKNEK